MSRKKGELTHYELQKRNEIFSMFCVLRRAYDQLPDKSGITETDISFGGHDGNDDYERKFFGLGSFNSHCRMLPIYRRMLDAWGKSANKTELTLEDVLRIQAARQGRPFAG